MSTKNEKYKGNIVQLLLFLAIVGAGAWLFQNLIITPAFQNVIVGFFAPAEEKAHAAQVMNKNPDEFLLDMSSIERTVEKDGYFKSAGSWVVRSEGLGEQPINISPWLTFGIFSIFAGFIAAVFITTMLPRQIGFISNKIERVIDDTIDKIDEQTGDKVSREEIERIASANSKDDLTPIAKEFGPVIVNEIEDVRAANKWRKNKLQIFKGLRLYMVRHFSEHYSNNIQGFAYGGAALLIVVIGIRGLKFIPPTEPSILLAAISLEFVMLTLLAITLYFTEEEQRMDKLMTNLQESSEGQTYELINLVRTSQQQQRDLASMVDYIQRQTDNLQRMADALTGANREYIIQVAQRAVAEYVTAETSREITEQVIREKIEDAMSQMFSNNNRQINS